MFERYTETARKVVFFARYTASQLGSEHIETEHLLLGIFRADAPLAVRVLKTIQNVESVKQRIEKQSAAGPKISVSADLPLSHDSKRVLAAAGAEAERLNQRHISTEHLLLALALKKDCLAGKILLENGVDADQLRQAAKDSGDTTADASTASQPRPVSPANDFTDLTAAARNGTLGPLTGRERELERVIAILSRRTRRNPVLIGEPGVGKTALVYGLAQRIADGLAPESLAGRPILAIDASTLLYRASARLPAQANAILFVHGLFDLTAKGFAWDVLEALQSLGPQLDRTGIQCIATATPLGFRLTMEKAEALARHFETVAVLPPNEEETFRIVAGVRQQYEKFHGVVITDEAIQTAISASRWFLRHRQLPDRAIDLIDDAGASVKLRYAGEPGEITEIERRLRVIVNEMEKAIASHDFAKARARSDEERKERESLVRVREELKGTTRDNRVNPEDIVNAVASRAGVAPSVVMSMMQAGNVERLGLVANELAARIAIGGPQWTEALVAYLAGCTAEEAEEVASAIRAAKAKIDQPG